MPPFIHARRSPFALCGLAAFGLSFACSAQAQLSVFSADIGSADSYNLPETISIVPAGFGAASGQIFIPDANNNVIHVLPVTGGDSTVFTGPGNGLPTGLNSGLFVPASYGGAAAGKYVVFGVDGNSSVVDSSGAATPFVSVTNGQFTTSLIAPASFGAYSGQIIVMDEGIGIQAFAINPAATATKIAGFNLAPFGSLAAPAGFGSVGGKILVDNGNGGGDIVALGADGSVTPFANIPLQSGQRGLRQMTMAPAGFFPGVNQPLLLVSVTGSTNGGGTLGDVVALDSNGNIIESLRTNLGLTAFDPRGLFFLDDTHLLLSDSSHTATRNGQILELTSNAFTATTPEPGTVALLSAFLLTGGACFRSRRARRA